VVVAVLVFLGAAASAAQASSIPTNVPVTDAQALGYQAPSLVVNPTNPRQLAVSFQEANQFKTCYLGLSNDGGVHWTQLPLVGQGGRFALPTGYTGCLRPSFSYGRDGTLYYAYSAAKPQPSGHGPRYVYIYLITSTDGGASFHVPVPIDTAPLTTAPTNPNVGDQWIRVVSDPTSNRVYATWTQVFGLFAVDTVFEASSTDHGQTFSPPVQVNPRTPTCPSASAAPPCPSAFLPYPSVGPDGRLYIAYDNIAQGATNPGQSEEYDIVSSADQGRTFTAPVLVRPAFTCSYAGPNTCPPGDLGDLQYDILAQAAAGISRGQVLAVNHSLIGSSYRLQFSSSSDAGRTWSAARIIGIPPGLTADNQVVPTMSIAPDGRIDIVYYDLAEPSGLENTYLTSSSDGGSTFSTPQLLSSAPSNTATGPQFGFGNGEHEGSHLVTSTNDTTFAAWTDSRRGDINTGKEDIFFASVHPPRISLQGLTLRSQRVVHGGLTIFTVRGALRLPSSIAGLMRSLICRGSVTVAARRGNRTGARRTARLHSDCSFSLTVVTSTRKLGSRGRYNLRVTFPGNPYLNARSQARNIP
jgi:hypothetical protein